MKLNDAPRQEPAQGNLVRERAASRLTPRKDHRVVGVPKAIVDADPARRALIASLTKQVLQSPNRSALMKEPFPEDGKRCTHMSEEAKTVAKEQGDVEALELLELTDTVQCVQFQYIYDFLGTSVVNVDVSSKVKNPDLLIEEQIQHFLTQKFGLLTTTAFVLRKGPGRGRRYGISQEQQARGRAKDSRRRAQKTSCRSILQRWFADEPHRT